MVLDQPHHQFSVFPVEAVALTKTLGVDRPQFRMIPAPALAYIVVERRDVEQFGRPQTLGNAGGYGKLIGVVRAHKAPGVGEYFQGMGFHRVGVEQIELHLADDTSELGQVASQ